MLDNIKKQLSEDMLVKALKRVHGVKVGNKSVIIAKDDHSAGKGSWGKIYALEKEYGYKISYSNSLHNKSHENDNNDNRKIKNVSLKEKKNLKVKTGIGRQKFDKLK